MSQRKLFKILTSIMVCVMLIGFCASCGKASNSTAEAVGSSTEAGEAEKSPVGDESQAPAAEEALATEEEAKLEITKALKNRGDSNPIIAQDFGADPFALVYGDRVYFYMTADAFEYDGSGNVKENTYSQIRSIHVVSTSDMKNFEDHGLIKVAGADGAAKWAHNSWAPSAAYKNINGKDKFFLFFADNGGGIGVLESDSPTGPFTDPIGKALISRDMENCGNVLWLFDPAVLVDDDGSAYIYFGGGVPFGKEADPGTGRVARLTDDMTGIDGDVLSLDVPYLFEDSGIHKYNGKYYYSYCTNWNVDEAGKADYGFTSGQIAVLESDSPMGPFTYKERVLDNPGSLCGLYGNNHHAIFNFKDQWYITYHSRFLEKKMGVEAGYRATFVNAFDYKEDGSIGLITQSKEGPAQIENVNPFDAHKATCAAVMAGTNVVEEEGRNSGDLVLGQIDSGDYIEVDGVDFDVARAGKICICAKYLEETLADAGEGTKPGKIHVRVNFPNGNDIAVVTLSEENLNAESGCYEADLLEDVGGVQFLYFVFEEDGYTVDWWQFK